MDARRGLTDDQSKHFVKDHPLAAANMATTTKSSTECHSFLHESHIQILGIRFLKNDRKGLNSEVQNAMNYLLHEAVMSSTGQSVTKATDTESADAAATSSTTATTTTTSSTSSSIDLPSATFRIPSALTESVQIIPEPKDVSKFEHMLKSTQLNHEELFLDSGNSNLQHYLSTLLSQPITIPVNQLFLYRGQLNSSVERCLALNFFPQISSVEGEHPKPIPNGYQQCLVLYAESPAKITDILALFKKLLGIGGENKNNISPGAMISNVSRVIEYKVVITAGVEIQEEVHEGKWHTCPLDKEGFKLRTNLDKKICINLQQDLTQFHHPIIRVERCFGMLLSPGRNIVSSDMVAIGLNSMNTSSVVGSGVTGNSHQQWQIVASWVPSELNFEYLNTETPRDTRVYFTIAVDLVVEHIDEPVRFIFEAKAKIVSPSMAATATEKFWQNFATKSNKQMHEQFNLIIRQKATMPTTTATAEQNNSSQDKSFKYEVVSCLSSTQMVHQKQRLSLQLNRAKLTESQNLSNLGSISEPRSLDSVDTPTEELPPDDDDEPLASGTGLVSKEISQSVLESWKDVMDKWRLNLDVRPKQLPRLVRHGVPEALRPEIWQLLAGAHQEEEKLMQKYRLLVSKESTHEAVIQRDINRTFPAHEKFRDPGCIGQESLFRICKAYSNYDEEIGYCQGLSFLVAALLLHMPEEQAFCVFVHIMYNYGLRNLYRCGLEELHCKFYQLERLLDDHMPELYSHFLDLNVETHMYASQWFLTLFTTKFPLNAVFLIIDLFLLDNMDTLLQIALALLKMSKNNLLALDFEGVMKYFRVSLPKKYRTDENARELIRTAVKISVKKSKKYEKEYRLWLEQNRIQLNPLDHLEKENKRLMNATIRLEQENDDLSQELLSTCKSKIKLQDELDMAEDKAETLNTLLLNTRTTLVETEEEKARLLEEVINLKEMCRKEIEKSEQEIRSNRKIIEEYKIICTTHQNNFELEQERANSEMCQIMDKIKSCESCSAFATELNNSHRSKDNNGSTSSSPDSHSSSLDTTTGSDSDKYKSLLLKKIGDLENELIQTKVALAEAQDSNGFLKGRLNSTSSELNLLRAQAEETAQHRSNTWFSKSLGKTLSTFRDATKVKTSNSVSSGISSAAIGGASNPNAVTAGHNAETTSLYEVNANNNNGNSSNHSDSRQIRRNSSRDIYQ